MLLEFGIISVISLLIVAFGGHVCFDILHMPMLGFRFVTIGLVAWVLFVIVWILGSKSAVTNYPYKSSHSNYAKFESGETRKAGSILAMLAIIVFVFVGGIFLFSGNGTTVITPVPEVYVPTITPNYDATVHVTEHKVEKIIQGIEVFMGYPTDTPMP